MAKWINLTDNRIVWKFIFNSIYPFECRRKMAQIHIYIIPWFFYLYILFQDTLDIVPKCPHLNTYTRNDPINCIHVPYKHTHTQSLAKLQIFSQQLGNFINKLVQCVCLLANWRSHQAMVLNDLQHLSFSYYRCSPIHLATAASLNLVTTGRGVVVSISYITPKLCFSEKSINFCGWKSPRCSNSGVSRESAGYMSTGILHTGQRALSRFVSAF